MLRSWDFYRRLTVQSYMSFNYRYVALIFWKFGEAIVKYCVKSVFDFPPFCFYYLFMKLFLFQSKTKYAVKDKNQNFTSNKLNEKKFEHTFVKKLICENLMPQLFLLKFLWKVGALESKKCSSWSSCFLWRDLPRSANYFFCETSDTPMINPAFQKKNWVSYMKKKRRSLLFLDSQKKLSPQRRSKRC